MYGFFEFQELIVILITIPVLVMLIVAAINSDTINNFVLKTKGTDKTDSPISNKEAWEAGFKLFYTLLCFSILILFFLHTSHSIVKGQWFRNFFKYAFLASLIAACFYVIWRIGEYLND